MRKLISSFTSTVLFGCIAFSAIGDDLDIYLGNADSAVTYNPNVIFIMDSSGSMGAYDDFLKLLSCLYLPNPMATCKVLAGTRKS